VAWRSTGATSVGRRLRQRGGSGSPSSRQSSPSTSSGSHTLWPAMTRVCSKRKSAFPCLLPLVSGSRTGVQGIVQTRRAFMVRLLFDFPSNSFGTHSPPPVELYAIIFHTGSSSGSGHYITYVKIGNSPDLPKNDQGKVEWLKFDDIDVRYVTQRHVMDLLTPFSKSKDSAYLIFYRRIEKGPIV